MKTFGMIAALVLAAGAAQAKVSDPTAKILDGYNGGSGGFGGRVVQTVNFNVAGIDSWDSYGDTSNTITGVNLGANAHVIGIGWNVDLRANSPSWLSELAVAFEDTTQSAGVFLTPGVGDDFPGTSNYSSGGVVDLVGLALDFNVGGDGILRMEFFENFDDFANGVDGNWLGGALTIQYDVVPAPGAAALVAGAGLVALRRRR